MQTELYTKKSNNLNFSLDFDVSKQTIYILLCT